jgi:hypothetical protein
LSREKPPNLPNMDIIKDKSNQSVQSGTNYNFMPNFVKPVNVRVSTSPNFCTMS